ncbi:GNAT family N-acetyltransferase [Chitinophaga sp.]|uniref:GNAT family N-acetyltransferase n=1 Tax=Chitinophaga sp. TaxID=1869181 RepID=UPI0031D771F5
MANDSDIPGMAWLRAEQWGEGTEDFWAERISGYIRGDVNPQQSLATRIMYVATKDEEVVGFIAGHLTQRFGCDGELQWINVGREYRGLGISSKLLHQLAAWFISQKALYICVNCAPDNTIGQKFYKRHGAESLNEHWLIWKDISVLFKDTKPSIFSK